MTYSEKLKDPRWQKKRLEILQRDNWTCCNCGDDSKTLHVHHRIYINGKDPWEYPDHLLVTLCEYCHEGEESQKQEAIKAIYNAFANIGLFNSEIIDVSEIIMNLPFINYYPIQSDFIKYALSAEATDILRKEFENKNS